VLAMWWYERKRISVRMGRTSDDIPRKVSTSDISLCNPDLSRESRTVQTSLYSTCGPRGFLKFLLTFTSRCLTISMSEGPKITLNNSFKIPAIGLGKFHKQICDHSCDLSTISRNLAVATWGSSRCCELCFKKWV
jgi:hypothetical protein